MEKISNDDQDFNLWVLLTRAREAMGKARKKELFPYGVSHREAAVLYVVQSIGGKATPAEIARWQAREPHGLLLPVVTFWDVFSICNKPAIQTSMS